ncbi:MAG: hypothetical protein AAGH78_04840 [Cyanobacteria bacterium P01_H01_bin.58]
MPQKLKASLTLPLVPKAKLYEFLTQAKTDEDEIEAENNLRQW